MWEARGRYAKKATNNYEDGDNQDYLFTEDGGSVKNQKNLSSRDARMLRDIVRTAGDRARSAQLQYKDAKSAKGLFGENAKIRKNADKVYREKVDDYFSDLFGETADYVEKMPKEMRDAAYAYVYEMWGFNY